MYNVREAADRENQENANYVYAVNADYININKRDTAAWVRGRQRSAKAAMESRSCCPPRKSEKGREGWYVADL